MYGLCGSLSSVVQQQTGLVIENIEKLIFCCFWIRSHNANILFVCFCFPPHFGDFVFLHKITVPFDLEYQPINAIWKQTLPQHRWSAVARPINAHFSRFICVTITFSAPVWPIFTRNSSIGKSIGITVVCRSSDTEKPTNFERKHHNADEWKNETDDTCCSACYAI